jgi:hypothetical protein
VNVQPMSEAFASSPDPRLLERELESRVSLRLRPRPRSPSSAATRRRRSLRPLLPRQASTSRSHITVDDYAVLALVLVAALR